MPEATSNVEFAHEISEHGHDHLSPKDRRAQWVEIAEAAVLAIVAVVTAWSGYQAAKWDAVSAQHYNLATRIGVVSQAKAALAGQDRLYDIVTFNAWVAAKLSHRGKLAAFYQRRFRPEYAAAFRAWMELDPVHNTSAPPGPTFMAEYKNANSQESATLAEEAKDHFEKGIDTREIGDRYVKITVFLATVLLLTALSQRFEILGPRIAVVIFALAVLMMCTCLVASFPRA